MKKIYFQKRLLESFQKNRERIAIEYGTREIKYSQLEKKCLSVSHWLLGHKTSKGSFIGIYIEDRVDFIAVLLGILNTGCVFIPLDTYLPVKRIEKMLQVTQPGLIICDQKGERRLLHHLQTGINPGKIICVSRVFNEGDDLQLSIEDVVEYSSEDPIYVYFTSGTTGTPKAILGKNISLLHFINWEIQTFAIDETFRVSQLTRQGFDAFLRDLFVPLVVGGTLCIPGNSEILMDSESLIHWLETNRIGLVHCVPSIFRIFNTKALKKENFQHLKYVLLSGENIMPRELKNWYDTVGDRVQLVNLYGPTETTMVKTYYLIEKEDVNRKKIPIGKTMPGVRLILFDKDMNICVPGFIGEIYIRTPYSTFGYYNDPQLNRERFIPNPLGTEPTDLLFKTGDLAVELPDGNFEFLGRRDRQVKIRGIRVELEEVERVMIQHPSIDNAVVIDREEKDRDKYLCAYFISPGTVEISELREYLSEELPDYMIPSYFQQLEAFPLSPNGKLDRKALPAPGLRPVENDEAPVGRIQETLVNIWSEVLKVDRKQIGINSDFFELGGHSLKAIMLASGIHQALNVKIALTQIFKTPTIRELSGYIKQEHKHLQAQDRYIAIEPVEEKEYYALSSAQKRLFILHQLDEQGIGYNMPRIVEIEGNLDRNRLEESFKKLTGRHESLRTSFEMVKDEPVQRIHQDFCLEIEYFNGTIAQVEIKEGEGTSTIKNFIRPFDFSQAPLLRVGLRKITIDKHILMVDMHHIISDAVSMGIFIRDFTALYSGAVLPDLKISYKDYSGWHNKEKEYLKHQEDFWTREFKGEISVLELPTDYARLGVLSFEGQRVRFQLEDKITNALNQLAREQDATLYMVLLAIYNVWLSKISGQEDIIVGSPIAGRRHADLEKIIGMFVNTMALRNYPSGEKNFTDFLREVRTKTLIALENQDYQFEDLVGKVAINRDLSRNPLFDVMFVLQNTGISKVDVPALKLKRCELETGISKFDLTFNCEEVEENLFFIVEFRTKLFTGNTIRKFIDYFKKIVAGVLDNKDIRMREIEILSETEQRQLLYDFNYTAARYPKDKMIHQLFESRVERVPENIAIIGPNSGKQHVHLTYNQLNKTSNQLAYVLKEKGVQPDTIVGIMIKRSLDMIIGIMGILKAGGAYLPIEPEYPDDRIKYMLEDSSAKMLMTTPVLFEKFKKLSMASCQLLMINEKLPGRRRLNNTPSQEANSINNYQLTINNLQLEPANLAYVIYTSGTTGKPKGVMIEHSSAVNLLFAMQNEYPIVVSDTYLLKTSYVFDVSVTELFGWYMGGGRVTILEKGGHKDPLAILDAIERNRVTHINFVPSLFNVFLEHVNIENVPLLSSLKYIFLAGEALLPESAARFRDLNTSIILENIYGPTESTVYASKYSLSDWSGSESIPIGKPLPNIKLYVLNKYDGVQPLGLVGELCICGAGLARGYLNRPGLTAEKFDHDLWDYQDYQDEGQKGADKKYNKKFLRGVQGGGFYKKSPPGRQRQKVYKTGDLARWLLDGNIEFLGRIDQQVKIRGFRIELGEIENRLLKYPGIKEVVVISRDSEKNDKYLCAYIVSAHDNDILVRELREYLLQYLPDYMIPSYFVQIEKIPLTPNGKVDRGALPGPKGISLREDVDYTLPSSAVEKKLVEIWEKVLGRNNIGLNENFFMMGGDSIKSIQIISRMSSAGYKLEMKDLFKYPVISALAPRVKKLKRIPEQSTIKGIIPLTPIQGDFFNKSYIDFHHYNQAVLLYSREGFAKEAIKEVFSKIKQHHDVLRITYKLNTGNGEIVQIGHDPGYPLSLQEYDLKNRGNSLEEFNTKLNQVQASIDLEKGPLMKLGLFHLDDGDRLLIAVHHLVIDGVSWRILFEDIETLYGQYKRGEKLVLPAKTDSFKLWSEKLSAFADDKILLQEKAYWQKIESVEVPSISKDFDVVDADNNYIKDTVSVSFTLSEKETGDLLTKVNEMFRTEINDILLTALGMGIKKTWGHDRVLIALEGHGREEILEDIDISRTVGWFTSLYPVLIDISYSSDPGRQIKEIKETLRRIPNKGIGYGILKYLTEARNKKEIEFKLKPQISFNYLGQFDADVKQKSSFEIAGESAGNWQGLNNRREYVLDVSGMTANNRITMTISYNKMHFKQEKMVQLIGNFESELKHFIAFCCIQENIELTPSDFTYKGLSIQRTDELMKEYPGIEDIYTLTPMQEGMLFHSLVDDTSVSYFEQMSYRLQGELDIELVEKSLNELFKRHDILRTVFVNQDIEKPVQVVLKERAVDFNYEDISQIGEREEKEVFIEEYKGKDKVRSFNLEKDVLMRAAIFRVDESEYEFTWSHHHILMDGWCIGILNTEFFEIYNAYLESRPNRLPGVKAYRTYIRWLEKQDKEAAARYWANYLESFEEQTGVPKTRIAKEGSRYKNRTVSVVLDKEKTAGLNKLASRNHVTLNTVTQAVWGILLGRYNGKEDMVFGAVVSGRPSELPGVESMVGLFINTIPVRIRFEVKMKFYRLLQQVQKEALAGEPYHYHPLAEIQSGTALKQNLIDHLFIFENYPIAEQLEGYGREKKAGNKISLELANVEIFEQTNYDFNIVLVGSDRLRILFKYNGNVYDRDFVERIAKHFSLIVDQVIENPGSEIKELTILAGEEKNRLLYEFNDTEVDYPKDKTIYQLFEEQVERTPGKIAVVFEDKKLTYNELGAKTRQLAWRLREKGVIADAIVGIMVPPGLETPLIILAVLKAGGGYLPLDPEYPGGRINYILDDSNCKLLLLQNHLEPGIKFNGEVINIQNPGIYSYPGENTNLEKISHSKSIAYTIYTSGTTGKPKGVLVKHENLTNYVNWFTKKTLLTGEDKTILTSSFAFDLGYTSVFPSILNGGELHLLPKETYLLAHGFLNYIRENHISYLKVTPSFLSVVVNDPGFSQEMCRRLRLVVVGGEAINLKDIKKVHAICSNIKIMNHYGPTEAAIGCIARYIDFNRFAAYEKHPTIGTPIDNGKVYILDNNLKLLPVGIAGELCISGICLARGYLNRPGLTSTKFEENPYTKGELIYRTGDLAKWMPDGTVEFLGRIDNQVKIRGYRIELGEIESQLLDHEDIKEAVVLVRQDENKNKYLCAFIISDKETGGTKLRDYLSIHLPDYMIPSYFMQIEKIPLTSNGKIDRKGFPDPEVKPGAKYSAPTNEIEEKLVELWSEILGIKKEVTGIDANFFELGGHSLKAIMLMSKIHKELNVKIPLAEIFKNLTIRKLAGFIKGNVENKHVSIEPVEKKQYYALSSAQKRLYFLWQMDSTSTSYNLPRAMIIEGKLDRKFFVGAFRTLISRHEALRTSFHLVNGKSVQKIHEKVEFEIEYYDLTSNQAEVKVKVEEEVVPFGQSVNAFGVETTGHHSSFIIQHSFFRPFDLTHAPLLRVGLMETGQDRYLLLLDKHHIITDGVTEIILIRELIHLYEGENPEQLPLQYKDYSEWQNKQLETGEINKQKEYWLNRFKGKIPILNMRTDYRRQAAPIFHGDKITEGIGPELTGKIKDLTMETDTTLFMVLLAAWYILLSKYTNQEDITVGIPAAGRNHPDLEHIAGMFVNTLAMRNYPAKERNFADFLQEVKTNAVEDYENQDYPFDELVHQLDIPRNSQRNPLFDVLFVSENIDMPELAVKGLRFRPYSFEHPITHMDLVLYLTAGQETIHLILEYSTGLFKEETAKRMLKHYTEILTQVVENKRIALKDITISHKFLTARSAILQEEDVDFTF